MADTNTLISLLGFYNNFDEPTPAWNHKEVIIGLTIPFLTLSWICVTFRLYTRLKIIYAPGWDDVLVLLFLLTGTANAVGICIAADYGLGQHLLALPYANMIGFLKSFYVANASYAMSTALIKASLLFQYLRIFDRGSTRIFCIIVLVLTCLWGAAFTILAWFPCYPVSGYWTWAATDHCWAFGSLNPIKFFATYASHAVTNMVLDFVVLAIPMPLYFRDTTSWPTRRRLLMLLSAGTMVSGISIWRLAVCIEHKAATYPTFDPTWYGPGVVVLGMMEVNAASVCACIPVFWPVLTAHIDQIFVTQEVKVTRERRFSGEEGDDDELELNDSPDSLHSRNGSITSQSMMHLTKVSTYPHDDHLGGGMAQVYPLGTKTSVQVVSAESAPRGLDRKTSVKNLYR